MVNACCQRPCQGQGRMALDGGGLAISEAVTLSVLDALSRHTVLLLIGLPGLCVHCTSTWLIGCSCTRLAHTGHASWATRRHGRGKVARCLDQETICYIPAILPGT